jgi:hypothetical protein
MNWLDVTKLTWKTQRKPRQQGKKNHGLTKKNSK